MKTICIYPQIKKDNEYVKNFINVVSTKNNVIEFTTFLKKPYLFFSIDIFHFNWLENVKSTTQIKIYLEILVKIVFLIALKICGKKIIWTMHNKKNHDSKSPFLESYLYRSIVKLSDKILIHSRISEQYLLLYLKSLDKVSYIPHGDYINPIKNNEDYRDRLNIQDYELVFLFIGQVREYKNIELLIECFKEARLKNSKLIIAGKPASEKYKEKIENLGISKDIILKLDFLSNEELIKYINTSNLVILPYDTNSSLNSGTIMLSFSNKKTVISSEIGTIQDINQNFYYSYTYVDEADHKIQLISKMQEVYNSFKLDKSMLEIQGLQAYEYTKKNCSWNKIKDKILDLYY